ncbi:hypothetical protein ACKVMT_15685 [Halobacteriales archaeon Cl-PHB]
MDDHARRTLEFVGSQLVFVAALVHLGLGLFNWWRWAQVGFALPRDGRWPLFVVSGLAILAGIYLAYRAENPRPYYLAGAVAMLGYVAGYFTWHLLGHRVWVLFGPGAGTETLSVQWLLDHATAGAVETVSLLVEVLAAAILLVLYFGADTTDEGVTLEEAMRDDGESDDRTA